MNRLTSLTRRIRRTVLARRRPLAALSAAGAVAVGLQAASPDPPARATVLTAAHDIPAGTVVRPGDVRAAAFAPANVPEGALRTAGDAVGRTTAAPLRAGEPVTDARLVAGALLDGYPGRVGAPVRISDVGAVALLRVGDRVDVLAADPRTGRAEVVAESVPVLTVPRARDRGNELVPGALVVLAVTDETARALAGASAGSYLSLTLVR